MEVQGMQQLFRLVLPISVKIFLLFTISPALASAQNRIALVIGSATYSSAPLTNPTHDADDIAKALEQCDFNAIKALINVTAHRMGSGR